MASESGHRINFPHFVFMCRHSFGVIIFEFLYVRCKDVFVESLLSCESLVLIVYPPFFLWWVVHDCTSLFLSLLWWHNTDNGIPMACSLLVGILLVAAVIFVQKLLRFHGFVGCIFCTWSKCIIPVVTLLPLLWKRNRPGSPSIFAVFVSH